ncbi:hypothetical protein ACQ4PT_064997 [Festuca glaucescens]
MGTYPENQQPTYSGARWLGRFGVSQARELRAQVQQVVSGKEQSVSGMNYELVIDVSDVGGKLGRYKAEVYEQEWTKTRKLISFSKAN